MLNRRHLRVKVLQTLYAYNLSDTKSLKLFESTLLSSVDEVYEMYIMLLALLIEVTDYAVIDADGRANKYVPEETDLNVDTSIQSNMFVQLLKSNSDFQAYLKKYGNACKFETETVKAIFDTLKETEDYKTYLATPEKSLKAEKEIIKFIYKKIIRITPAIDQIFEERFINWPTDKEVMEALLAKTFSNFQSEVVTANKLAKISPAWAQEDKGFILDLLNRTITFEEEFQELINSKTQNWDPERIAIMDIIIMKMAITEMMYFSSIPVKVTMNEYIEIAKEYSTPKSNSFINGILDKILSELKDNGKVKKSGRGLME